MTLNPMTVVEEDLYNYMVANDISDAEARECAATMAHWAAGGAVAGFAIGYKTGNPAALLMAIVAGAGTGLVAGGLECHITDPTTAQVQDIVSWWLEHKVFYGATN